MRRLGIERNSTTRGRRPVFVSRRDGRLGTSRTIFVGCIASPWDISCLAWNCSTRAVTQTTRLNTHPREGTKTKPPTWHLGEPPADLQALLQTPRRHQRRQQNRKPLLPRLPPPPPPPSTNRKLSRNRSHSLRAGRLSRHMGIIKLGGLCRRGWSWKGRRVASKGVRRGQRGIRGGV